MHWLYLKLDLDPAAFLEKVLQASKEGKFRHLLEIAGYVSMNQALSEFMAFCWWMSLGSPEDLHEPFNASFKELRKKNFFVSGSRHDFNSMAWEVDKLDYWKFFPLPGHSYFFKGQIDLLKSGWELVTAIPEEGLMIFMAIMSEGKILEVRRLKGFSELAMVRSQLPENEEAAVSDDDQRHEVIMEMFKSGRNSDQHK
ncbi:MAG: hypothetical protein ACD_39C01865G0001 [uncultured bacterium]|nr:MAG: hypothetical protein ACD_39C01865G0001 [uncultured bacterium]